MQLYSKSSMNVSALVFKVQVNNLIAQANLYLVIWRNCFLVLFFKGIYYSFITMYHVGFMLIEGNYAITDGWNKYIGNGKGIMKYNFPNPKSNSRRS